MMLDSNPTDNNREEEEEKYIDSFDIENLFKINNSAEEYSPRCFSIKVPRDYQSEAIDNTYGSSNNIPEYSDSSPWRNARVEEMK